MLCYAALCIAMPCHALAWQRGAINQSHAPPTMLSIFATTSSVSFGSTASAAMLSSICVPTVAGSNSFIL